MTLTAAQTREARTLLGWMSPMLAKRAWVRFDKVLKAQDDARIATLSALDLQAFENAGIEFTAEGVRLRKAEP